MIVAAIFRARMLFKKHRSKTIPIRTDRMAQPNKVVRDAGLFVRARRVEWKVSIGTLAT